MAESIAAFAESLQEQYADRFIDCSVDRGQISARVSADKLIEVATSLRDDSGFEILIDVCGMDYSTFGQTDWQTQDASRSGFSRGVSDTADQTIDSDGSGFAAVYQLLSIQHNQRLRLRVDAVGDPPRIPSVNDVWNSANWFEREAFDLFGILFEGHPDLRRLLTDYGFIGHPFRKDFPLIGHVEVRYDSDKKRVVYQPVTIEPRTLVPRVIRDDDRFVESAAPEDKADA